jgi:hypothetical protein
MQPSWRPRICASLALLLCFFVLAPRASAKNLTITSTPPGARVDSQRSGDPKDYSVPIVDGPPLTNQDVVAMTKAGLSSQLILDKISSTALCQFDTSVAALTGLKSSGVDDSVLSAMIRCRRVPVAHDQPQVWIGANEERISSRFGLTTKSSDDSSGVTTQDPENTTQTHSEFPDVARALREKCAGVTITDNKSDADYLVTIERYHSGHLMSQRNEFSVFRSRDGGLILSDKTKWLKNAAADICESVLKDAAADAPLPKRTGPKNPTN